MNNIERLQKRLNNLKASKNKLQNINNNDDTNITRNFVLIQSSIDIIENAIANNGIKIVNPPDNMDLNTMPLKDKDFNSDIAIFCTYLVQLAYKIDVEIPCDTSSVGIKNVSDTLLKCLPPGSKIVKILVYNCMSWLFGGENTWGGFIFEYNDISFISLRGTIYPCEWYVDTKVILTSPKWLPSIKVHTGFNDLYSYGPLKNNIPDLREQILDYLRTAKFSKLFVSGHSLGAGITGLLQADMTNILPSMRNITNFYQIAPPHCGNTDYVNKILSVNRNRNYTGVFLIINNKDIVPNVQVFYDRLPSQLFCFTDPSLSVIESHSTENYIKNIVTYSNIFNLKSKKDYASCGPISCTYESTSTYSPITIVKIGEGGDDKVEEKSSNKNTIIILLSIGIPVLILLIILYLSRNRIKRMLSKE